MSGRGQWMSWAEPVMHLATICELIDRRLLAMEVVDMHFLEDERGQKFLNTRTCTEIHEIDKYFNALRTPNII